MERGFKNTTVRTGVTALLAVGSVYLGLAESRLDLLGDMPQDKTDQQIRNDAKTALDKRFRALSPAGRIAVQYAGAPLPVTKANEHDGNDYCRSELETCVDYWQSEGTLLSVPTAVGGKGLLGGLMKIGEDQRFKLISQDCLAGTGYDTTPSEIRVRGFGVSGGGDISAVATINPLEDGVLAVTPASGTGESLKFVPNEATGGFDPAPNGKTVAILEAYGCNVDTTEPLRLTKYR